MMPLAPAAYMSRDPEPAIDGSTANAPHYAGAQLPLVSFIIVNYNYGRYLRQCVESIFGQTYPRIECIVVDNKSTDDSVAIIAGLRDTYPQLKAIYESANLGQSVACVHGYNESKGHFVVFVDADDYYFETFVATHLLVHMSSSQPVGFSSSDMVQVIDGTVVGTSLDIPAMEIKHRCHRIDLGLPPAFADICTRSKEPIDWENLLVRYVDPKTVAWVWSPTSGTMYRRDALALFTDCENLASLRHSTDAFFNYAINAITGSLVIERPLAAYRIHGQNQFTQTAALRNLCNYREVTEEAPLAATLIRIHVVKNFDRFADRLLDNGTLNRALRVYSRKAAEMRLRGPVLRMLRTLRGRATRLYWQWKIGL